MVGLEEQQSDIQHARSGGFASALVRSGVCGSGESASDGNEAVRQAVNQRHLLHLWSVPLEEVLPRAGGGW